ncbi:MAG: dTDP-4-amino-4,6-dideoxygalactose transaminase [Phycisphaerales bacterium]|nr:dTDP-4-amino-4,6-dideoxygalactose transaminase [Phycisphaerales bacterium]
MSIRFNHPTVSGEEIDHVIEAIHNGRLSGDNAFCKKCQEWFNLNIQCHSSLLTPSCTHALEMAALLLDIEPGDEIIMPSYTFVSTANAFALRGAKIVFVDIRPDTMNINEELIEDAINEQTKAVVPVHYAGVSCEMNHIVSLADEHSLYVIEDAAQAIASTYNGQIVGSMGNMSAYSFHETKNITSGGEGGLLAINDERFVERANIIREKGTNRTLFFEGLVDKYTWVDIGSSYLPSELQAAFLYAQLQNLDKLQESRFAAWNRYYEMLKPLETAGKIELPVVPNNCMHNAHMFYIKTPTADSRSQLLSSLNAKGISAVFHYIPLHTSPFGQQVGRFHGEDRYTTVESERLLRLPLWSNMKLSDVEQCCNAVIQSV